MLPALRKRRATVAQPPARSSAAMSDAAKRRRGSTASGGKAKHSFGAAMSAAQDEPSASQNAPSASRRSARSRGTTSDNIEALADQGTHAGTTAPNPAGRFQLGLVFILALLRIMFHLHEI